MNIEIPTIIPAVELEAPTAASDPIENYFPATVVVPTDEGARPLTDFLRVVKKETAKSIRDREKNPEAVGEFAYTFSIVPKGGKTTDSIKSQFPNAGAAGQHAIHARAKKVLGDKVSQLNATSDRSGYGVSRLAISANGDYTVRYVAPKAAPKSKIAAPAPGVELAEMQNLCDEQEARLLELEAKLAKLIA
tara:strand:- start:1541 stop:2113 length:573 start_codon:yes stop_codon:yes gene_type:complete